MTDLSDDTRSFERQVLLPVPADSTEAVRVPIEAFNKAAEEVKADFAKIDRKIHRFPAVLRGLGKDGRKGAREYIVPMAVSIGPYHHGKPHLQAMEKVKQAAASHFIRGASRDHSGHSAEEMYNAVLSVADEARSLYADDAVVGISRADFAAMMFRDACFLLQLHNMLSGELDASLHRCFFSNQTCIRNDIMLLENQLPWLVVETLMRFNFKPVDVKKFIAWIAVNLQIRRDHKPKPFNLDDSYKPPHLLGLVRFYLIGRSNPSNGTNQSGAKSLSVSISAIELAEIGIKLTASTSTDLKDMGFKKGHFFGELFMPPLYLNVMTGCWLVNLAAFEVCTASSFQEDDKFVVCSYLAFLAMLMDREEDVHELRTKRLVHGKLTNKETLDFFKSLAKHLSGGPHYFRILAQIEGYKVNRSIRIKVHEFVYNNIKIIVTVLSIIGILAGIFKTLLSLKQNRQ